MCSKVIAIDSSDIILAQHAAFVSTVHIDPQLVST